MAVVRTGFNALRDPSAALSCGQRRLACLKRLAAVSSLVGDDGVVVPQRAGGCTFRRSSTASGIGGVGVRAKGSAEHVWVAFDPFGLSSVCPGAQSNALCRCVRDDVTGTARQVDA